MRDKEVDVVIAYTLDRLSSDLVHFISLQEELEKAVVALILVTETVRRWGKRLSNILARIPQQRSK